MRDGDLVPAVVEAPSDGVEKPEEDEEEGDGAVVAVERGGSEERDGEEDVGEGAEGEEAPFVVGGRESAGEPGCDPSPWSISLRLGEEERTNEPGECDVEYNGGPADAREQANCYDEWCPANKPGSC